MMNVNFLWVLIVTGYCDDNGIGPSNKVDKLITKVHDVVNKINILNEENQLPVNKTNILTDEIQLLLNKTNIFNNTNQLLLNKINILNDKKQLLLKKSNIQSEEIEKLQQENQGLLTSTNKLQAEHDHLYDKIHQLNNAREATIEGIKNVDAKIQMSVCRGSEYGLTHSGSGSHQRYSTYKHVYKNCTFVDGNLEIVFLEDKDNYDLSFLSDIKEVTGYVLISNVFADYIPLTSLRIIRGRTLFNTGDKLYSLYVSLNYKPSSSTVGLKELRFKSLYEIRRGDVLFFNNKQLCYENTIHWNDIFTHDHQVVRYHSDSDDYKRTCVSCPDNCRSPQTKNRHCWGSGRDMCQKFRLEKKTAFSAYMDSELFEPSSPNETVPFEEIDINYGNHYDSGTSTFTCPLDGVYFFTYTVFSGGISKSGRSSTLANLEMDGTVIGTAHCRTDTQESIQCQVTNSVTIHCNKESSVRVTSGNSTQIFGSKQTTFIGFLLNIQ